MKIRHRLKKQASVQFLATTVVSLWFAASFLVVAETNDVEHAMVTDSDGDGMTDWNEWQAGTNPGDPSNCFEISTVSIESGKIVMDWKSVGTAIYEIVSSDSVAGLATNPQHIAFVKATGGAAPWHQTLSTATNNLTGSNFFIRIRLVVPQNFEQSTLEMATFE